MSAVPIKSLTVESDTHQRLTDLGRQLQEHHHQVGQRALDWLMGRVEMEEHHREILELWMLELLGDLADKPIACFHGLIQEHGEDAAHAAVASIRAGSRLDRLEF